MTIKKKTQDVEIDPDEVRNARVDEILQSGFQLEATGTIFLMGQESTPSFNDVLFCLNRVFTCGYAERYTLLPFNVDNEILVSALTKEMVAWLVPQIIGAVDRKTLSGQIDILSPNNETLVYLMDVLGWYWYKVLRGPKPVVQSLVKMQIKPKQVVQNAALVCPMCYHQFSPPKNMVLQSAKAWAYARWFPKHLAEYHRWPEPGTKGTKSKKGGTK